MTPGLGGQPLFLWRDPRQMGGSLAAGAIRQHTARRRFASQANVRYVDTPRPRDESSVVPPDLGNPGRAGRNYNSLICNA
jgi:hypothetical protein